MAAESEGGAHEPGATGRGARPRIAIEDQLLRDQLRGLLESPEVEIQVLTGEADVLQDPAERRADLLIVRRSSVPTEELHLVDEYTSQDENPGLLVVTDGADDVERAELLSAGVSGLLEAQAPRHHQLDAVAALTSAEHGRLRDPHVGRDNSEPRLADFLSRSRRMQRFLELVQRVVDTDSSLLITGETGVGKERLAQAIHYEGPRASGPFVSVNCGAIPEQLLESELFGHEEGAFTGASRLKKGRFELAHGGTIFLDEIGEMPQQFQVNLLTVLQRRRVHRVGGEETIPVDVRVMAATNRDVLEEVEAGRFREDLYYRLNVVTLEIPPLRERPEDIPDLVGSFIRHLRSALCRARVESISDEALTTLMAHPWPGNIRQLVNAVEHAIVICRTTRIEVADLPESIRAGTGGVPGELHGPPRAEPIDRWLDLPLAEARREVGLTFEKDYLEAQLARAEGRVGKTAELCGITPRSLYDKLKLHGLRKERYRG
jgi:DNA-binding NtrC family response regulator